MPYSCGEDSNAYSLFVTAGAAKIALFTGIDLKKAVPGGMDSTARPSSYD